jgi:hypothetical protein
MKLSKEDVALFYELMWSLQFYANQKLGLIPEIKTLEQYRDAPMEKKAKVRQSCYTQPLFDGFLQENPQAFSDDKLVIVEQWKQFISGKFYIERMLKKYTIFIDQNDNVYGVWGLQTDFDEMFYPNELPRLVEAILLPFKDKIIYDGLLQGYNLLFGSGISSNLKEIYLRAKQRGEIIESLPRTPVQPKTSKPEKVQKDWGPELEELLARSRKLRGGGGQPAIYSPIFSLIKLSLELGHAAVSQPEGDQDLWKLLAKVEQAVRKVERTLY